MINIIISSFLRGMGRVLDLFGILSSKTKVSSNIIDDYFYIKYDWEKVGNHIKYALITYSEMNPDIFIKHCESSMKLEHSVRNNLHDIISIIKESIKNDTENTERSIINLRANTINYRIDKFKSKEFVSFCKIDDAKSDLMKLLSNEIKKRIIKQRLCKKDNFIVSSGSDDSDDIDIYKSRIKWIINNKILDKKPYYKSIKKDIIHSDVSLDNRSLLKTAFIVSFLINIWMVGMYDRTET